MITVAGCSDTSACYVVNSVGIDESIGNKTFDIYPNPAKNILNIAISLLSESSELMIRDSKGVLVYNTLLKEKNSMININSFQNGVYFVTLKNRNTVWNKKFTVIK
jgi:hypothetical protein